MGQVAVLLIFSILNIHDIFMFLMGTIRCWTACWGNAFSDIVKMFKLFWGGLGYVQPYVWISPQTFLIEDIQFFFSESTTFYFTMVGNKVSYSATLLGIKNNVPESSSFIFSLLLIIHPGAIYTEYYTYRPDYLPYFSKGLKNLNRLFGFICSQ